MAAQKLSHLPAGLGWGAEPARPTAVNTARPVAAKPLQRFAELSDHWMTPFEAPGMEAPIQPPPGPVGQVAAPMPQARWPGAITAPGGMETLRDTTTPPLGGACGCGDTGGRSSVSNLRRRVGGPAPPVFLPSEPQRRMLAEAARSSRSKIYDPYGPPIPDPCGTIAAEVGIADPEYVDLRNAIMIAVGRASDPRYGAGPPVTTWIAFSAVRDLVWIVGFCEELQRQIDLNPRLQLWMRFQTYGLITPEIICKCIAESTRDWIDVALNWDECVMAYGESACRNFDYDRDWPTRRVYQVGANFHTLLFSPEIRCVARVCVFNGIANVQTGYRVE